MAARKPTNITTLVLGVISLLVSLVLLGIFAYYAASLGSDVPAASPFLAYLFIDLFVLVTASALTISAALHDLRGLAIAGMVFQILGTIIGFVLLFNGFIAAAGVTIAESASQQRDDIRDDIPWDEIKAVLYVIGTCGLVLVVVLIWASAMMCRFLRCCQCCGQPQPQVVVVQQTGGAGLPAYEVGQYTDQEQVKLDYKD